VALRGADQLDHPADAHPLIPETLNSKQTWRLTMGLGRGLLLWMIGIPLPLILLLALFMHH
jgi:hypothetical protein